jgi:pimeloyl-ACP methyl ester carboxylesterase
VDRLDALAGDVAAVKAYLALVSSPAILVGHSYGGTLITHAGTDPRVAGLVYIAALAPDADETSQSQQAKFPVTDVFSHIEAMGGGSIWCRSGERTETARLTKSLHDRFSSRRPNFSPGK